MAVIIAKDSQDHSPFSLLLSCYSYSNKMIFFRQYNLFLATLLDLAVAARV